jgi:putative membrane protein
MLALLLVPLGAVQSAAQEDARQSFSGRLASLSHFLVESAELALSRGQEESVTENQRRFVAELREALVEEGVDPAADLSEQDRNTLQALETAIQNQFDNAYFSAQVIALESMIQLMKDYGETGPEGSLKTFATNHIGGTRTLYLRAQDLSVP